MAESDKGCQLIGGHVEKGESPKEALIREVMEESGIELKSKKDVNLFFVVNYYYKIDNKNKHSRVMYYYVKNNEKPNHSKTNLTDEEIEKNLVLKLVDFNSLKDYLKKFKYSGQKK